MPEVWLLVWILAAAADPTVCPSPDAPLVRIELAGGAHWPAGDWCAQLAALLGAAGAPAPAPRAQRLLSATGLFRRVQCAGPPGPIAAPVAGSPRGPAPRALSCRVEPAAIVSHAEVDGAPFPLVDSDLERRLVLRPGTVLLDPASQIRDQRQRLLAFLHGEGFFGAQIEVAITDGTGAALQPGVEVHVTVRGARSYPLGDVAVVGAAGLLDEGDARDRLEHYWLPWVWPRRVSPQELERDRALLEADLRGRGHPEARVEIDHAIDPRDDQLDVVVRVDPGPRLVVQITGEGIEGYDLEDLADLETFSAAGVIDEIELENTAEAIREAFQRAGHYAASVRGRIRRERDPARAIVTYEVRAGPRAELVERLVVGNEQVPRDVLEAAVDWALRPSSWLHTGRWTTRGAARDRLALLSLYEARGFGDAEIEVGVEMIRPGEIAALYRIREGRARVVREVTLPGLPPEVDPGDILDELGLRPGSPFVSAAWQRDQRRVATALAEAGFLQAELTPRVEEGPGGGVTLRYEIVPGMRARLGGLLVRGNFRTAPSVVLDELDLEVGDPLDAVRLAEAEQRLRDIGVFHSVRIDTLGPFPDGSDWLVVALQESAARSLDAAVRFTTDDLFALGVDYRDRNWLGRALQLSLQLRFANASEWLVPEARIGNRDRFDLSLSAPSPFELPFDASISGFYLREDQRLYDQRHLGTQLALSRNLLRREDCLLCPEVSGSLGYVLDSFSFRGPPSLIDPLNPNVVPRETGSTGRIFVQANGQRVDSLLDPRLGWRASVRGEVALPWLAPDPSFSFWRVVLDASGYVPLGTPLPYRAGDGRLLGGPVVAAARLELGTAAPLAGSVGLPVGDAFFYGGDGSLRGAEPRASAAALLRATQLFLAQVELRWYFLQNLAFGDFQITVLTDVGSVARRPQEIFRHTTVSSGVALRYITPIGPVTVAYAWPWLRAADIVAADPAVLPTAGRLHLTLGVEL